MAINLGDLLLSVHGLTAWEKATLKVSSVWWVILTEVLASTQQVHGTRKGVAYPANLGSGSRAKSAVLATAVPC